MKKTLTALASLVIIVALVGSAQAGATARTPGRTTKAPPAVSAATRAAMLAKLESSLPKLGSKRLTAKQLTARGFKPLSREQAARINRLLKSHSAAKAATAGTSYWYTYQYYGNIWSDVYASGPYYPASLPAWDPFYILYDNFKVCTASGAFCNSANAYTFQDYVDWYGTGMWYYWAGGSYSTTHLVDGFLG